MAMARHNVYKDFYITCKERLEGQHKKERLLHSVLINSVIVNCRYFYLHF
jgi:hypothetical protein